MLNVAGLWQEWFICKWKIILKLLMIQPRPSLPPPTPSHTRSTYQHLLQYLVGFIQEKKHYIHSRDNIIGFPLVTGSLFVAGFPASAVIAFSWFSPILALALP